MKDLASTLEQYGADLSGLRLFNADDPDLLPYVTLIEATRMQHDDAGLRALIGVYEWQSSPLVFLVNADAIQDENHFRFIRRCIALQGEAPYLGVISPGQLTVHRVALDKDSRDDSRLGDIPAEDTKTLLPYLANFRPNIASHSKWISQIVLRLLRESIRELIGVGVAGNDAISLTGRALFLRFLGDRDLLPASLGEKEKQFDNAARAEQASTWLDDTFNGDFLPIPDGLFAKLPQKAFYFLSNILYRAPGGQLHLGWEEKWDYLDFAHIPVGVLSETYEQYMREHDPDKQRKEGSYYTPRAIADLMVKASFHALRRDGKANNAMVLDPAAGAGVFLVSAFRQLVSERWKHDQKRPDTQTLRDILYHQIVGFDINEAALRFAALGLYLMSIELDPEPLPVEKLRFDKNLRGVVLYDLSNGESGCLGSLGKAVPSKHVNRYDLVIGNPPWAMSTRLKDWHEVSEIVTNIAEKRLSTDIKFPLLPNEVLDLPVVWRAMEWAKPGGQIAFALHARLLFQQAEGMSQARSALFRAIDVSGVINGAELRQTKVWPDIAAPFCLLFARNHPPAPGAAFRFVSPHVEGDLNDAGVIRIDVSNSAQVTPAQVANRPEILKILYRGSTLDLELFDRLASRELVPLEKYWKNRFKDVTQAGNGYQKLGKSSRIRKHGDGKPGVPANYLEDLQELTASAFENIRIDTTHLPKFNQERIHDKRPRSLFMAPLLVVRESPSAYSGRIRAAISEVDLVYKKSYQGYSAYGDPNGKQLIRYLTLLISSKLAIWLALMSSGRFGVEREVIESKTIDNFPIVPFETLNREAVDQIDPLFEVLVNKNSPENWEAVDAWVAALYGLQNRDLQVINDTLRFNLPFAKNKNAAQSPPTSNEISSFCNTLEKELKYWAKKERCTIKAKLIKLPAGSPWTLVQVRSAATDNGEHTLFMNDWPEVLRIANNFAATEVICAEPNMRCLWLARLNQARYWSLSQARLAAQRIIWEHLDSLLGSKI